MEDFDVIIIGAGPAGTACASKLRKSGQNILIIEKSLFPRFTIGESLLPQNMELYDDCGLSQVFTENKFQYKDGAEFLKNAKYKKINFKDKSTPGPSSTFQVKRDEFDHLVANKVISMGVKIYFEHSVTKVDFNTANKNVVCEVTDDNSKKIKKISAKFIVDASGFAKVLPKLLNLETIETQQLRKSLFTHIKTKSPPSFDTDKVLIAVDDKNNKNWFWTIPLSDNLYSLGVIINQEERNPLSNESLINFLDRNKVLKESLGEYELVSKIRSRESFGSRTTTRYGEHFVLLGNSGEFLDPIFSSGVTVALKSASLAASLILKKINNSSVDWNKEYLDPLNKGVQTFKAFVDAWYTSELQEIIFADEVNEKIRSQIISILAGYAWDEENPFTTRSSNRLKAVAEVLSQRKN